MKPWARREARAGAAALAMATAHEALAYGLDRAGLVERLLSPSGAGVALSAAAALALFGLRLWLLFIAPGWLVARGVIAWVERRRAER